VTALTSDLVVMDIAFYGGKSPQFFPNFSSPVSILIDAMQTHIDFYLLFFQRSFPKVLL